MTWLRTVFIDVETRHGVMLIDKSMLQSAVEMMMTSIFKGVYVFTYTQESLEEHTQIW